MGFRNSRSGIMDIFKFSRYPFNVLGESGVIFPFPE